MVDGDHYFDRPGMCFQCVHNRYLHTHDFHATLSLKDFFGIRCRDDFRDSKTFGVELEVDGSRDFEGALHDLWALNKADREKYFWMIHDGSLRDGFGFELASKPATLDYHLTRYPWSDILEIVTSHGYRADDMITCGLHIHVGAGLILPSSQKKMAYFIYGHPWEIQQISRRYNTRGYAKFKSLSDAMIDGGNVSKDRYEAINFATHNASTIEFRCFQGTTQFATLAAYIEFVDAVSTWVAEVDEKTTLASEGWSVFYNWIMGQDYSFIPQFLQKVLEKA
jgi:hypothetical protein